MLNQLAHLTDPLKLEFEAEIVQKTSLPTGQIELILTKTYFYPTSGGQSHDTGSLGGGRVVDVFKDNEGAVVHRLEQDIGPAGVGTKVTAKIDEPRRVGHMQHHSAQHILSCALEQVLALETVSAKISADRPSTIDLQAKSISRAEMERVEALANRILFENRPIKTYFITDDELERIPFRRPPKVKGKIRVVEVLDFDYSACGGTHCPTTGMVGLIKVIKQERQNKKVRLYFVAGGQALRYFQSYHDIIGGLSRHFNTAPEAVLQAVTRQTEQLGQAQRQLKTLRAEMLRLEAQALVGQAEVVGAVRLVMVMFQNRSLNELRALAKLLQKEDKLIVLLAGYAGQKVGLVVSCGAATGVSAAALLAKQLVPIGGRGGGDTRLAQGGGQATLEQVETFWEPSRGYVQGMLDGGA